MEIELELDNEYINNDEYAELKNRTVALYNN